MHQPNNDELKWRHYLIYVWRRLCAVVSEECRESVLACAHADGDKEICLLDLFRKGGELDIGQGSTSSQGMGVQHQDTK